MYKLTANDANTPGSFHIVWPTGKTIISFGTVLYSPRLSHYRIKQDTLIYNTFFQHLIYLV